MTKVMPCTCRHAFQDREYGDSMRLHNHTTGSSREGASGGGKSGGWRCTVCGKVKSGSVL